ncbi:MAG: aminoacyl-tRNA hydrolase [Cyanobacteria bacterium P01_E01_bin.6]
MTASNESLELVKPTLIVGLGNPGSKYNKTRHNVGFDAVDMMSKAWRIPLTENKRFTGEFGEGLPPVGEKVRLLKPLTYMNRSGQSIRAVMDWYKVPAAAVVIIYDDMDLPTGRVRLRLSGSAGGHNGMKSAIAHMGTQGFPRIRIGVGRPTSAASDPVVSHVLGKFSPAETKSVDEVLYWVLSAMELTYKEGFSKAMSLYNGRDASAVL